MTILSKNGKNLKTLILAKSSMKKQKLCKSPFYPKSMIITSF